MQEAKSNWLNSLPARIWHGVTLVLITLFVAQMLFGGATLAEGYAMILKPLLGGFYVIALPSFLLVISGRAKARSLLVTVGVISAVVALVAGWLLFGMLQSALGVTCKGLFGVQDANNCTQIKVFWLSLLIFPQVFLPALLISAAALVKGLVDQRSAVER